MIADGPVRRSFCLGSKLRARMGRDMKLASEHRSDFGVGMSAPLTLGALPSAAPTARACHCQWLPGRGATGAVVAAERRARRDGRGDGHERATGRPVDLRRVPHRAAWLLGRICPVPDRTRRARAGRCRASRSRRSRWRRSPMWPIDSECPCWSPRWKPSPRATTNRGQPRWPNNWAFRSHAQSSPRTPDQLRDAAVALGYPDVAVCIKPTNLKGSRGFLVVSANTNRRWHILEARPGPLPLTLEETIEAIGSEHEFPSMLVMDYIQGPEHTVDAICRGGRFVLGHAKTREAVRAGLAMFFQTVDEDRAGGGIAGAGTGARNRLVREPAVHRWTAARDQSADLDDRVPGGSQPAVSGGPPRGGRD